MPPNESDLVVPVASFLLGCFVGALFVRHAWGHPNPQKRSFGSYLVYFGLGPTLGVFGPCVAFAQYLPKFRQVFFVWYTIGLVLTIIALFVVFTVCVVQSLRMIDDERLRTGLQWRVLTTIFWEGFPSYDDLQVLNQYKAIMEKFGVKAPEIREALQVDTVLDNMLDDTEVAAQFSLSQDDLKKMRAAIRRWSR